MVLMRSVLMVSTFHHRAVGHRVLAVMTVLMVLVGRFTAGLHGTLLFLSAVSTFP
jgi:hypothetical protein